MADNAPSGVIGTTQETNTAWVLRNLHKSVQFRTDPEDNTQDQYREVLRIVITRDLSEITEIASIDHEGLSVGQTLYFSCKGTEERSATSGTNFSRWHMTDQRFDEMQQEGSLLYRETREYIAISWDGLNDIWENFEWDFDA